MGITSISGYYRFPLNNQFFLPNVPRASAIFGYYDRTQDNVFPYGPGTPNRQGIGMDLDVKALKNNALKIVGAAYLVQEIDGNLVVNKAGNAFAPLDPDASGNAPVRKFTYLNFGPSIDLGPLVDWEGGALQIGTNLRMEQTDSTVGTLTSTWLIGEAKVGLFPWLEFSAAFSNQDLSGTEEGYDGSVLARYSYLYDNTDLGRYHPFTVNGNIQALMFTTAFKIDRNSTAYFDYSLVTGNDLPGFGPTVGTLNSQTMEMVYEIQF